jgi:sugar phosphate isomerase/epimerase
MYVPNHVRQTLRLTATDRPAAPPAIVTDDLPLVPDPSGDPFQLGITLYSASAEFRAGWYDFDGLLDRIAALGIGPGIEIVASQMIPSYPAVSDEFVATWRAAFDRHGFAASSFGANLDMGRRRDRDMTPDEEFEMSEQLFRGAKKLGFPLVRIQSAKPDLLRRLLPVAEELGLKLAYEIHAPMGPNAPEILKVRDVYAQLDSPLLGFVADFSATMHAMSPTLLRAVRRAGLDDEAVDRLQQIWATDAPMRERQQEFIGYLQGRDFDPGRLGAFAHLAFNMHGHVDPREWADIMPQILHVHAKFYDIDATGQEPAIDYPEHVRVFAEGGYRGYWSSEWEGHAFAELGEVDPLVLVRRQHDLIRASMQALA